MRRGILSLLISLLSINLLLAQSVDQVYDLDSTVVVATRALKEIGIQKNSLERVNLRDNIAYSLSEVLTQNSSIFIKSYGRATSSTASLRGTSPSHTRVEWNGMKLNSPMLGMVDFSLIPSFFIDNATIYHGSSSVGISSGGFGGAISLESTSKQNEPFSLEVIGGIGSFSTYNGFLRAGFSSERFQSTTKVAYNRSTNDFEYVNYRKKEFDFDNNGNLVGFKYPTEKNKNGEYADLHLMQELAYRLKDDSKLSLSAWYINSERGVPMLNVNYREEDKSSNTQYQETFRTVFGWDKAFDKLQIKSKAGYDYNDLLYLYLGDLGDGKLSEMTHSQSFTHSIFAKSNLQFFPSPKLMICAEISLDEHIVKSYDIAVNSISQEKEYIGYFEGRFESSALLTARYRPSERLGLALNLRESTIGDKFSPLLPAFFAEYIIIQNNRGNIIAKSSVSRNFRAPTLNDLYFLPGGNKDLRSERGYSYDLGFEGSYKVDNLSMKGELTAYNSKINDWILWLPTFKGFWSPINVKLVHSYGIESKANMEIDLGNGWNSSINANFAWTRSINHGDPISWGDESVGKQLVYVPEYSASVNGRVDWKGWSFNYKWNYYSERFTTSSNSSGVIGRLSPYIMNDISLEKSLSTKWAYLKFKLMVENLFDEEYESVLSHPMPGRNYTFTLSIKPKFF